MADPAGKMVATDVEFRISLGALVKYVLSGLPASCLAGSIHCFPCGLCCGHCAGMVAALNEVNREGQEERSQLYDVKLL
jgi:hypothetical protein